MRYSSPKFGGMILGACLLLAPHAVPVAQAATGSGLLQARQGVSALLRGKYEKAVASYTEALGDRNLSDPRRANIYNDRGVAKWRLGQPKEAVEDFNKAISLFPDYAVVYNNRGNALLDLGQPKEAIADFDRAITLAPAYGAAFNNRGNAHHALGDFEAAARDFRKAVSLMPTSAVPYNGRGKAHSALGRPFAAVRDFNRAIVLNAKYYSAHLNRAEAQASRGDFAAAVTDYSQVIELRPENPALYLARARLFTKTRKYNSAFRDFDKALKLSPDLLDAYRERASLHMSLKRYKSAHKDLTRIIELSPEDHEAHIRKAEAALRLGKGEEGLVDVNRALELKDGDIGALLIRAKIYESLAQPGEALADYAKVIEADPRNKTAREAFTAFGQLLPPVKAASAASEPQAENIVGEPVKGWSVVRQADGRYAAVNKRYPKLRVALEMYGSGEPQIIDWTLLKYELRGIGLLEYYAGTRTDQGDARLEYVAIVDLWKSKVAAIEPDSWGASKATWTWQRTSVVVTDPEGGANEIKLRKAAIDPYASYQDDGWFDGGYWRVGPPPSQQRRKRRRPEPRGIFDWLLR